MDIPIYLAERPSGAARSAGLRFQVLGPFEAFVDGRPVHVGGPQIRRLLARLVVDVGRTVRLAALVEELWGFWPPADARRTAQTYASRLRNVLVPNSTGTGVIVARAGGYLLDVEAEAVDAARFELLVDRGRGLLRAGSTYHAHQQFGAALALWRGAAFGEFDGGSAITGEAARLERLRLAVLEDRIGAALALGLEAEVVDEVEALVRAYPLRERLWGQWMVALFRTGRQAEALTAFQELRAVLITEQGVEPSPMLADIHRRILAHDPRLAVAADHAASRLSA